MSCGIYKITNPNNRIYIGQSKNIVNRWNQHKYQYGKNNIILSRSILKYGYEKHKFEIIENCSVDELNQKEIYWINYYKSNYKLYPENNGLNLSDGGDKPPLNDMPLKEKTKLLISEKNSLRHCEKRISNIKQFDKTYTVSFMNRNDKKAEHLIIMNYNDEVDVQQYPAQYF